MCAPDWHHKHPYTPIQHFFTGTAFSGSHIALNGHNLSALAGCEPLAAVNTFPAPPDHARILFFRINRKIGVNEFVS